MGEAIGNDTMGRDRRALRAKLQRQKRRASSKISTLAFGAVYIYTSEGLTDEKVREHIQENPHMQYFCGFDEYTPEPPFDASLMVHFRKRIPAEMVMEITEKLFTTEALSLMDAPPPETPECDEQGGCDAAPGNELHGSDENATSSTDAARETSVRNGTENETPAGQKQANRGTLILDATCCPQDIKYPTDIGLLNHARELCEEIM
jgi:hypothetical protein